MHLRLGLNSFLPTFAIVDTAGEHDNSRAREVCAGLQTLRARVGAGLPTAILHS